MADSPCGTHLAGNHGSCIHQSKCHDSLQPESILYMYLIEGIDH